MGSFNQTIREVNFPSMSQNLSRTLQYSNLETRYTKSKNYLKLSTGRRNHLSSKTKFTNSNKDRKITVSYNKVDASKNLDEHSKKMKKEYEKIIEERDLEIERLSNQLGLATINRN